MSQPGRESRAVTITVAGDHLIIETPGMGKQQLSARSETLFFPYVGPAVEFVNDDHGEVSHLIMHAAESDQKAVRRSGGAPTPVR